MAIFSRGEMERRWAAARAVMLDHDLAALVATSYAASYYLSGTPIHCFGRPMATVIPLTGDPFMITSIIEQGHVAVQSWISDFAFYWDYNTTPDYRDPQPPLESMVDLLADELQARDLRSARIGFEDGKVPVAYLAALQRRSPEASFIGASDAMDRLRLVLSPEELALTRSADAIADIGQARMIDILKTGKRARDLVEDVRATMIDAILANHPDMPFHLHVGTGLGSSAKGAGHSEWATWNNDDIVRDGQLLETVVSAWLWGYWGNVERAVYVGRPTAEVLTAFDIMIESNEAAIAATRPGVPLADVDRAAKDVLSKHGYSTRTGSGCGRGITSYEADARELAMDLRLYADVILAPGMVFSLEPDVDVPEIGVFRHCNTIIVTDDGCEVDSRLPRGVFSV